MRNAVTYTREMRDFAKEQGKHLITISIPGFEIQAPVSDEVRDAVSRFMSSLMKSRPGPPPDFETQADELWSALDVLCDEVADVARQLEDALDGEDLDVVGINGIARQSLEAARDILLKYGRDNSEPRAKSQEPSPTPQS